MSKSDVDLFTVEDVERYKKGLTAKQKEKWVKAANEMLEALLFKKESLLECEAEAVSHANSLFTNNKHASEDRGPSRRTVISEGKKIVTKYRLALQEADGTDGFQMILPIGAFHSAYYGEIIITPAYCKALVAHWQEKVLGNREPFIDTLHDRGKANGWITAMEVREEGLYAQIEWTKMGEENIREGYFKYFSSDLGEVTEIGTGEIVWPVLIAVALCNTPVMNTMPRAHLAETETYEEDEDTGIEAQNSESKIGISSGEDDPANGGPSDSEIPSPHGEEAELNKPNGQEDLTLSRKLILRSQDGEAVPGNSPRPGEADRGADDTPNKKKEKKLDFKTFFEQYGKLSPEEKAEFLKKTVFSEGDEEVQVPGFVFSSEMTEMLGKLGLTMGTPTGTSTETSTGKPEKKELAEVYKSLSPEEKTAFLKETVLSEEGESTTAPEEEHSRVEQLEAKVEASVKANEHLQEQVARMQEKEKETKRKQVIEAALAEGKILPKDREFWEEKYNINPEGITEILDRMPKGEIFTETGTGGEGGEGNDKTTFSAEDKHLMKKLGLSEEDVDKYKGGVKWQD